MCLSNTFSSRFERTFKVTLFQSKSALEGSAGPQPMEWWLEDAPQGPSVDPGEANGIAAPPGTAWPCPVWPLELSVTMPPR